LVNFKTLDVIEIVRRSLAAIIASKARMAFTDSLIANAVLGTISATGVY
jgi:hypothetical protein